MSRFFLPGYTLLKIIGKGASSTVWKAIDNATKEKVAVKIMEKFSDDYKSEERFQKEAKLISTLKNSNIVTFIKYYESSTHYFLVLEYLKGGTLKEIIEKTHGMQEESARKYFKQILHAINYLHCQVRIIHRDIKSENIMIDSNDNIRIIDFGFAKNINTQDNIFCGSPKYAAPEIYSHKPYSTSADVWSLGVLLFYMLTGEYPFDASTLSSLSKRVRTEDPVYPSTLSSPARSLITSMLSKIPENRPSLSAILASPWLSQGRVRRNRSFDVGRPEPLGSLVMHAAGSSPSLAEDAVVSRLVATGMFVPSPRSSPRSSPLASPMSSPRATKRKKTTRAPSAATPRARKVRARRPCNSTAFPSSPIVD